jgi:8-oxo-dGTP pyrophosphatase MutT (NUDIX family)
MRKDGDQWQICLVSVKGRWEIPKGHPEKDETAEQTAIREISEETGLPASGLHVTAPLTPSDYAYQSNGKLIFKRVDVFLVMCDGNPELRPQVSEVDAVQWFLAEEAKEIAAFRDTKNSIDEAMEHVSKKR